MVIKRMLESNILVAGGGAVETALSIYLESFATTLGSREQLAIAEFAEALLVIPKTLAVNAAQVHGTTHDGLPAVSGALAPAHTAAVAVGSLSWRRGCVCGFCRHRAVRQTRRESIQGLGIL